MLNDVTEGKPQEIPPKPHRDFLMLLCFSFCDVINGYHSALSGGLTDVIDFSKTSMSIPLHFSKRGWRTVI
mgnify:CR=1 FL=1